MIFNNDKEYHAAGSSGRADACPRMTGESGRSMVEMLGVLAIIGVLSVAGIAGFSRAMDKNRANTLINEAQKRATLIVPQIQLQNNANPTLTEFTNNNLGYAKFGTTVYTKTDGLPEGQFGIKLENVPKEVCQNLLNSIGDNSVIRRLSTTETPKVALTTCGDTNTFLMVYNNDMSSKPIAGEFSYDNCPENFYKCSTTTSCVASENDCPNCESTYIGTTNNGNGGFAGTIGSDKCYCENSGYIYDSTNGCQEKVTTSCTSFKDCNNGEYCQMLSTTCSTTGWGDNCLSYNTSSCQNIGEEHDLQFKGETYYYSQNEDLSWWSANDWCQANHKNLIDLSELDFNITTINNNGMCSKSNCGVDWADLRSTFSWSSSRFYWASNIHPSGNHYSISFNNRDVYPNNNNSHYNSDIHWALCK